MSLASLPKVSIVMAVKNEERYIKDAVLSILEQTYKNIELIIIDDHSNDRSIDIIKEIDDSRIRIFRNKKRGGVANSKNLGVLKATGKYVAIQDADDKSSAYRIEKQLEAIESENDIIGSWLYIKKGDHQSTKKLPITTFEIEKGFSSFYNRMTFVAGTMLAPRDLLLEFPLRSKFKYMSDWDQVLRIWESGKANFKNVPKPLYHYFLREDNSMSFDKERIKYNIFLRNCERRRRRGLEEYEDLNEFEKMLEMFTFESFYWSSLYGLKKIQHKLQF